MLNDLAIFPEYVTKKLDDGCILKVSPKTWLILKEIFTLNLHTFTYLFPLKPAFWDKHSFYYSKIISCQHRNNLFSDKVKPFCPFQDQVVWIMCFPFSSNLPNFLPCTNSCDPCGQLPKIRYLKPLNNYSQYFDFWWWLSLKCVIKRLQHNSWSEMATKCSFASLVEFPSLSSIFIACPVSEVLT